MAETLNETMDNGTVTEQTQAERTFTQAELDEIVKNRVAKEKARFQDYEALKEKASKFDEIEEANKTELQKATEKAEALQNQIDAMTKAQTIREMHAKVAKDTGVPAELLHGESEEECMEQAYGILAYKNNAVYPSVKDGGEIQNIETKKSVAEQFADWFNASTK